MSRRLTPVRGFWIGVVLTVVGLVGGMVLFPSMFALGGQELMANRGIYFVATFIPSVVFPLGLTLMVMSLIADALDPRQRNSDTSLASDPDAAPALPLRINSRIALAAGLVLLALGLVFQVFFEDWFQAIQGDETFLRDFVVYLGPPLSQLLLPLGVLLIPCAWVLRLLEERRAPAASTLHDGERTL